MFGRVLPTSPLVIDLPKNLVYYIRFLVISDYGNYRRPNQQLLQQTFTCESLKFIHRTKTERNDQGLFLRKGPAY